LRYVKLRQEEASEVLVYSNIEAPHLGEKLQAKNAKEGAYRRLAKYILIQGRSMRYSPAMSLYRAFFYYPLIIILFLALRFFRYDYNTADHCTVRRLE